MKFDSKLISIIIVLVLCFSVLSFLFLGYLVMTQQYKLNKLKANENAKNVISKSSPKNVENTVTSTSSRNTNTNNANIVNTNRTKEADRALLEILGVTFGHGFMSIYVKCYKTIAIRSLLIKDEYGDTICVEQFQMYYTLKPGVNIIPILPLMLRCYGKIPRKGYIVIETSQYGEYKTRIIDFRPFISTTKDINIVIFSDRSVKRSSLDIISSDTIDSLILYPLEGEIYYTECNGIRELCICNTTTSTTINSCKCYIDNNSCIIWKGRASIVLLTSGELILPRLFVSGTNSPMIIIINPTRGLRAWYVKVVDFYNNTYVIYLPKLSNNRNSIVADMLLLWEDQWSPQRPQGDNWLDIVLRLTIYANDTIRIHVLYDGGAYLHALFLNIPVTGGIFTFLEYKIFSAVLNATTYILYGETLNSQISPIYIKPFNSYSNTAYVVTLRKKINLSNVVWICNLEYNICEMKYSENTGYLTFE